MKKVKIHKKILKKIVLFCFALLFIIRLDLIFVSSLISEVTAVDSHL